jgi:cysteine desulfurase
MFSKTEKSDFLLMSLDMANICVSGGSACSSGASIGSHVIQALQKLTIVPPSVSHSANTTRRKK